MAARNGFRLIKFPVLLLTCWVILEIDVDLEALRDSLRKMTEIGLVDAFRQTNGTHLWQRRHGLGVLANASSLYSEQFFANFETWFVRDPYQDDDDDMQQPDDMFTPNTENLEGTNNAPGADVSSVLESNEEVRTSHLRVYLDLIASGQNGDFEAEGTKSEKDHDDSKSEDPHDKSATQEDHVSSVRRHS